MGRSCPPIRVVLHLQRQSGSRGWIGPDKVKVNGCPSPLCREVLMLEHPALLECPENQRLMGIYLTRPVLSPVFQLAQEQSMPPTAPPIASIPLRSSMCISFLPPLSVGNRPVQPIVCA